jgi:hypothetical protein
MRHLLTQDPESWTLADVHELVDGKMPEGQRIDYKRELHLDTRSQKAELAKDVSGLANAQGGVLLFGVDEDDSDEPLPTAVTPLPSVGLQTRVENVLDSTLEPVPDYGAASIPAGEDRVVIVVRVPAHRGAPVMVQGYGDHRYYRRSGTRTRPMTATEVAAAHSAAERRLERADERLRQLPLMARIFRPRSLDELRDGGGKREYRPLATVVVASIDGPDELIPPSSITNEAFEETFDSYVGDRGRVRYGGRFDITAHGLVEEAAESVDHAAKLILHRVAVYRVGAVEWAHRYDGYGIPSKSFAWDVHNAFRYAASVFARIDYAGRLATWVRIENAEKAELLVASHWDYGTRLPEVEALGAYREVGTDELLNDPTPTVREAMDRIWQGFGLARCTLFDQQGAWQ